MEEEETPDPSPDTVSPIRVIVALHSNHVLRMTFVHALRLAYASKGELEIVDVRSSVERKEIIGVREYLEKWKVLGLESKRSDVISAGLRVKKVVQKGDMRHSVVARLKRRRHDLLVVGTESRRSHGGIISQSLASYLADYFHHTTLFVPSESRPFVDDATGEVSLRRVLVPVENESFFEPAILYLGRLVSLFSDLVVEVVVVHSGKAFPKLSYGYDRRFVWTEELRSEPVVEAITNVAENFNCDLVVMSTKGRDTIARKLVGSNTEQILRKVSCPVLSVAMWE